MDVSSSIVLGNEMGTNEMGTNEMGTEPKCF